MDPVVVADESSLPRLLSTLYRRGFTGRAEIFESRGKVTVSYRRGRVVKAQGGDGLHRLPDVLIQERLAPKEALDEVLRLHGEDEEAVAVALAEHPAVGRHAVRAGIRVQLSRQLIHAFAAERPRFEVTAGEHRFRGADSPAGGEVDPRTVIYPGIRTAYDEARLVRELTGFLGGRARMLAVAPAFLREAGFRNEDETLLAGLRRGVEITEAWLHAAADPRTGSPRAVVLALYCLDLLDVQYDDSPLHQPEGPRHHHTGVTGLNAFEPATIARMAEAFFKNGDNGRAERAFALAQQSDPHNRRLQAFTAWLQFWKPGTDRQNALPEALARMTDVVRDDAAFAFGHYFLGSLQKLADDLDAAARSFRTALDTDGKLVEAERELRLLGIADGATPP